MANVIGIVKLFWRPASPPRVKECVPELKNFTAISVYFQVKIHPAFNQTSVADSDIALVRLKTPLALPIGDNRIAPICLPTRSMFINAEAELAGYGVTKVRAAETSGGR